MDNVYSLTYHKIKRILHNPKSSVIDLAAVVSQDRYLRAKLLRLVNSPHQGFPERIDSVAGAIIVLGFDKVEAIIDDQYCQYR